MAHRLRQQRLSLFIKIIGNAESPISILDVGGQDEFWKALDLGQMPRFQVTLFNRYPLKPSLPFLKSAVGDARNMSLFRNAEYDVVFSNSVIEHVGGLRDQKAMAQECIRVGKKHFIQTPNRHFPLEPHFLLPFFQYLPQRIRAWFHLQFNLGWWQKAPSYHEALEEVESIRLLNRREMAYLFPNSRIWSEKIFGLTKSFVAHSAN